MFVIAASSQTKCLASTALSCRNSHMACIGAGCMIPCPSCRAQAERAGLLKRLRQGAGADGAARGDAGMHAVLTGIVQEVSATQHGAARGGAGCAVGFGQRAVGVASPSGAAAGNEAGLCAAGKPGPLGRAGAGASVAPGSEKRADALWDVSGPPADGRQALQQRAALAKGAHAGRTCRELVSFQSWSASDERLCRVLSSPGQCQVLRAAPGTGPQVLRSWSASTSAYAAWARFLEHDMMGTLMEGSQEAPGLCRRRAAGRV